MSEREGLKPCYSSDGGIWQGEDGYRLPTEAEWEYACRAGSTTRFSFGDVEANLGEYSWHYGNSVDKPHPVGQKQPNAWGIYDMYGNVYEWCWDGYAADYYKNDIAADPRGPLQAAGRVVRGGSWFNSPLACRSANRLGFALGERNNHRGFRVARVLSSRQRK
jgi:formylglycine-generating enzyme required for sulfatase activity